MVETSLLPAHPPYLLQLHIELRGITPKVWRRFVVPENITLGKLHDAIRIVMEWGYCEHEFEIAGKHYGRGYGRMTVKSQACKTLVNALNGSWAFSYFYDVGGSWHHQIIVEKKLSGTAFPHMPYCIEGANASPPEGLIGAQGYRRFLEAMANPRHPEHLAMVKFYGCVFVPSAFWCGSVNQELKRMRD